MKHAKPRKYRSKILSLLSIAALIWISFTLSASAQIMPVVKMIAAYISWGLMIYLLMGFFFTYKPSGMIAILGGIAALGAELGRFDLTSLVFTSAEMPVFFAVTMIFSLVFYGIGIATGWMLESLLKRIWKRARAKSQPQPKLATV